MKNEKMKHTPGAHKFETKTKRNFAMKVELKRY